MQSQLRERRVMLLGIGKKFRYFVRARSVGGAIAFAYQGTRWDVIILSNVAIDACISQEKYDVDATLLKLARFNLRQQGRILQRWAGEVPDALP